MNSSLYDIANRLTVNQTTNQNYSSVLNSLPGKRATDISHIISSKLKQQSKEIEQYSVSSNSIHELLNIRKPLLTPPIRLCLRPNHSHLKYYESTADNDSKRKANGYTEEYSSAFKYPTNECTHRVDQQYQSSHACLKQLLTRCPLLTPPVRRISCKADSATDSVITLLTMKQMNLNAKGCIQPRSLVPEKRSELSSPLNQSIVQPHDLTLHVSVPIQKTVSNDHLITDVDFPPPVNPHPLSPNSLKKVSFLSGMSKNEKVIRWLEFIGVPILSKNYIPLQSDTGTVMEDFLEGMTNGIKLADIVERLEGKPIPGIDRRATKKAAIYNNVNRVLTVLRQRKNLNPTYLWSVREIIEGDVSVIWGLLGHIYEEYGKNFNATALSRRSKSANSRSTHRSTIKAV